MRVSKQYMFTKSELVLIQRGLVLMRNQPRMLTVDEKAELDALLDDFIKERQRLA